MPKTLDCEIKDDLIDSCISGDVVTICGIMKTELQNDMKGGRGGGGGNNTGNVGINGAKGGNGVVIVAYPGSGSLASGGTISYSAPYTYHTFTNTTGSFSFIVPA